MPKIGEQMDAKLNTGAFSTIAPQAANTAKIRMAKPRIFLLILPLGHEPLEDIDGNPLTGLDGLIVPKRRVEGRCIEKNRQEQCHECYVHGSDGLAPCDFDVLVMCAEGDDHGRQGLQKEHGGQGEGQKNDGLLDQVAPIREGSCVVDILQSDHDHSQGEDDDQLGHHHKSGDLEEHFFNSRSDGDQDADCSQSVEGIMRQHRLGNVERAQIRGAVVGDGRGVRENPDQQHAVTVRLIGGGHTPLENGQSPQVP